MCNSTIATIYIPSIHKSWTRSEIIKVFAREGYGNVLRIDFVRIVAKQLENDSRTFDERTNPTFQQAFIRLDVSEAKKSPFLEMIPNMQIRIYPARNRPVRRANEEYWMCLAAAKPLSDSDRELPEIMAELNDLLPLLNTQEEKDIFAQLYRHARLLFAPPANYDDYCEMNRHQLDNNVKMLAKRIRERENPESV